MTLRAAGLATAAVAMLGLPASAVAQFAHFQISVSGSQVLTWQESTPANPSDPCSVGTRGEGSQSITFKSKAPAEMLVIAAKGDPQPTFEPVGQNMGITVPATAEREGTITPTNTVDPAHCGAGENGGGAPAPSDCGSVSGQLRFELQYDPVELPETPYTPPADATAPNAVILQGDEPYFHGPLAVEFMNCPFPASAGTAADADGYLQAVYAHLPVRWLFDRHRRRITLHRRFTYSSTDGDNRATTVMTYDVTLRRAA